MINSKDNCPGILIIGGYPPPYGGITVHIKRLHDYCKEENIKLKIITQFGAPHHPDVISLKGSKIFKLISLAYWIRSFKGKIIHIHSSRLSNLIWGGLLLHWAGRKKIRVITNHSGNFSIDTSNSLYNIISKYVYKYFNYIICLNKSQQAMFHKVLNIPMKRLPIIPSYIPMSTFRFNPSKKIEALNNNIHNKVKYLIVTTGYLEDYYGYEILIKAVKKSNLDIGIVFIFYTASNLDYRKKLIHIINNNSNMWYVENILSDDMMYIIQNSSIFVRANFADTYGMVIGDAIQLGIPVIASDICPRHKGTILFETGDADDLCNKIIDTINHLPYYRKQIKDIKNENNAGKLIEFYQSILED